MKIEYKKEIGTYNLFISRTELLKSYKIDKESFYDELSVICRYFCTIYCFGFELSKTNADIIMQHLKSNKEIKFVKLVVKYDNEGRNADLEIIFLPEDILQHPVSKIVFR